MTASTSCERPSALASVFTTELLLAKHSIALTTVTRFVLALRRSRRRHFPR